MLNLQFLVLAAVCFSSEKAAMKPHEEEVFPAMSPADVTELTDEQQDKQNGLKGQGADALEDGNQELALEKFSEAISVGCASALLYARRAQLLFQLGRPRATVNDCNAALEGNPDSAKAYKIRAKAYLKLERWEEAHSDFQTALKIDYDEQTYSDSLEVAAKVKEAQAAQTQARNKSEEEEYHKTMAENKRKYEEGMKANEEKFREERMKEEEEKQNKESERRKRVRTREQEEAGKDKSTDDRDDDHVPTSHGPPAQGADEHPSQAWSNVD